MSSKLIEAVLIRAQLPDGLRLAIKRLVESSSLVLIFDRFTCAPLTSKSGLAQGCPLSCILYVLAVDPMLEYASPCR